MKLAYFHISYHCEKTGRAEDKEFWYPSDADFETEVKPTVIRDFKVWAKLSGLVSESTATCALLKSNGRRDILFNGIV